MNQLIQLKKLRAEFHSVKKKFRIVARNLNKFAQKLIFKVLQNLLCSSFEKGIKCYNDYKEKCIGNPSKVRLMDGEVVGAKNFHEMLCKDAEFEKDFLKHKECFRHIEKVRWVFSYSFTLNYEMLSLQNIFLLKEISESL